MGDILTADFVERFDALKSKHLVFLEQFDYTYDPDQGQDTWMQAVEYLKQFKLIDAEYYVNDCLQKDKPVLAEGAQGALLDIDFAPILTSHHLLPHVPVHVSGWDSHLQR